MSLASTAVVLVTAVVLLLLLYYSVLVLRKEGCRKSHTSQNSDVTSDQPCVLEDSNTIHACHGQWSRGLKFASLSLSLFLCVYISVCCL